MSTPITEPQQPVQESVPDDGNDTGATFELDKNDPRRTDNRGGLEATLPTPEGFSAPPQPTANDRGEDPGGAGGATGTTGAAMNKPKLGAADDVGAAGSGTANRGQVNMGTTGMAAPDAGPPGAGPVEGSQSGAVAPRVEMTDVGLVDVNTTDVSELGKPTDDVNS